MKFLIVASYAESIKNFSSELLDEIEKIGFSIHVVIPNYENAELKKYFLKKTSWVTHFYELQRRGTNLLNDFKTIIQLKSIILKVKPDIIFSFTIKPVIYSNIMGYLLNIRKRYAFITGVGYLFYENNNSILSSFIKNFYRISLNCTTTVIFQNKDDISTFYSQKVISKKTQIKQVNGSGVNINYFKETPIPNKINFLMIARLLVSKGVREYAAAAEKIKKMDIDAEFFLAGWFDEGPDSISKEELNRWKKQNTITYHGELTDVRPLISSCSIYVLPSYREGTPRTVLEAMSMGRPIITTNVPGCRETVINNYNGFLVERNNTDSLVSAMQKFISKPEMIQNMGRNSRSIAESKYDVNLVNEQLLSAMDLA